MAEAPAGQYMNFMELREITQCSNRLQAYLRRKKLLLNFSGPCVRCGVGTIALKQHAVYRVDGQIWRCSNRKCAAKTTIRKYSFFAGSHLSLDTIMHLVYYWTYKYTQLIVRHETRLSRATVVDFFNFCREVCCVVIEEECERIGEPGKVVEIDESKFGKRKFNKGKHVDGVWVFGGIERDSNPPKCFFVTVADRSALISLIKKWILPGTTILSDCWKAYSSLVEEGYIHETVNHSIQLVSDTGVHTNNNFTAGTR